MPYNNNIQLSCTHVKFDCAKFYCYKFLCIIAKVLEFWREPSDQTIHNNRTATFECFVNGSNSRITVNWVKDGLPFTKSTATQRNYTTGVISNLTLNRATLSDSGKYQCNATNVDGDSFLSKEAELISNNLANNNQ